MPPKRDTSWGKVADWYGDYVAKEGTYQSDVILPNLIRILNAKKGERVLDLACGQGFFTREIAKQGAEVVGADIAPELIAQARTLGGNITYHVAPAERLSFAKDAEFNAVVCVLALQNMENISTVFKEVQRVLAPGGRFLIVLNHPTFRVMRRSSWQWDEEQKIQYRRIDGYLSAAKISVDMNPGKRNSKKTISFHRSLQDFFKAITGAGLVVSRLEEWTSHKVSEKGPRQKSEDTARKEIPLFMAIEGRRFL